MGWLEVRQSMMKPWTEARFRSALNGRFTQRSLIVVVRKLEEFRFKRLQAGAQSEDALKYDHYIATLEWVLNGRDTP